MKYSNFEDVPVWQAEIELTVPVFELTEDKAFRFKGDIANQIQRADAFLQELKQQHEERLRDLQKRHSAGE